VNSPTRGEISTLGQIRPGGEVRPWGPGEMLTMALCILRWMFAQQNHKLESLDVVLGLLDVPVAHRVREGGQVVGQLPAEVDLEGGALPLRGGGTRCRARGFGRRRVAENESCGCI
jgi:hypothetical protein